MTKKGRVIDFFRGFWAMLFGKEGSAIASRKKSRIAYAQYFILYTVLFAVIFALGYYAFFLYNYSFIWNDDGYRQHYVALQYIGRFYRELFSSILAGAPTVPAMDLSIGMGDSFFRVMAHNGPGDLLQVFSAFVPENALESYYNWVVVVRLYMAGFTFSICALHFKGHFERWAILLGALAYTFCGYMLIIGVRHSVFLNAVDYLPLVILGLDMILKNRSPILFTVMIFLLAMTGFYMLFMITIFVVIYALVRVYTLHAGHYGRAVLRYSVRTILFYILGVFMAAAMLLPLVYGFLTSSRALGTEEGFGSLLFFQWDQYMVLIKSFIVAPENGQHLAYTVIVLPVIVALVAKKDIPCRKPLLILLGICFLLRLMPVGSQLMNGMSYTSYRWSYILAFVLCAAVAYVLPYLFRLTRREAIPVLLVSALYIFLCMAAKTRRLPLLLAILFLVAVLWCILRPVFGANGRGGSLEKERSGAFGGKSSLLKGYPFAGAALCLGAIVCLNLVANARITFTNTYGSYVQEYDHHGETQKRYSSMAELPAELEDTGIYRSQYTENSQLPNAAMVNSYYGVTEYWSTLSGSYANGMQDFGNADMNMSFQVTGFDDRTALGELFSVKYKYVAVPEKSDPNPRRSRYIPYGFEWYGRVDDSYLYVNKYALPLGYTYDTAIPASEYKKMSRLNRQESAMQAVALPIQYANATSADLTFSTEKIPAKCELNGMTWKDGKLVVQRANATMRVSFEGLPNSETYVQLAGLDSELESVLNIKLTSVRRVSNKVFARFPSDRFYMGNHNYLINAGYRTYPQRAVTLTFSRTGEYTLDDVRVYCYPMDEYAAQAQALGQETLENVQVATNRIGGDISLSKNKFLVLSVPYDRGWKATVDGVEQELLPANGMFMALPLDAGDHRIELYYVAPGLKIGLLLSCVGFVLFVVLCVFVGMRAKRRKGQKAGEAATAKQGKGPGTE